MMLASKQKRKRKTDYNRHGNLRAQNQKGKVSAGLEHLPRCRAAMDQEPSKAVSRHPTRERTLNSASFAMSAEGRGCETVAKRIMVSYTLKN